MVEAKEARKPEEKKPKPTKDRAAELVARKKGRKGASNAPYYGIVFVFVIIVALILGMVFKPKPRKTGSLATAKSDTRESRRVRKKDEAKADRKATRAAARTRTRTRRTPAERVEREARERPARKRGARVTEARERRPKRGTTRKATRGPQAVMAIFEGSALVGERTVRAGDVVRGRLVKEVGPDYIRVEYGGAAYTLRVGDELP
jgi:hypothetical protein